MKNFTAVLAMFVVIILLLAIKGQTRDATGPAGVSDDLKIKATPDMLERGKYLVDHVILCTACHSTRDLTHFGCPIIPGTEGQGGEDFSAPYGKLKALNITPFGIGKWSDYGLYKTLVTGMNPDGDQLFPVMPYTILAQTSKDDIFAIIAYIRTLRSIDNTPPERELVIPEAAFTPPPGIADQLAQSPPDTSDKMAYTKYYGNLSPCVLCHTPADKMGIPDMSKAFSGGYQFAMADGRVVNTANITPDLETGIGLWSKERFINYLHGYCDPSTLFKIGKHSPNTFMPVDMIAGMTDEDLGAVYDFLRTVPPAHNVVEKYPMP